ncbi:MAG TPA: alpha-amylase family glycosyl hydrolase [Herpetosiphonaceae bacterium]
MTTHRWRRAASLLPLFALLATVLPLQGARAATVIATVAGNFQSEIGCPDDWQPACDNSLMSDSDNDGIYTFTIAAGGLPTGSYEYKVALNRTWDLSYPANNVSFTIAASDNSITFSYNSATNDVSHTITGSRPPAQDNDIFWDGLAHNSRDTLYRTPGGAVTSDTQVLVRFRTFHNDVTGVTLRSYHTGLGAEKLFEMQRVATGVDCYQPALHYTCDFWQATVDANRIGTLYYRFIAKDGTKTVYYEDDSDVRDGGWGAPYNPAESQDRGFVITVYDPNFRLPIRWMQEGVVYQIFPDRFRNADPKNDPTPDKDNPRLSTDPRYAYPNGEEVTNTQPQYDQIVRMKWGELPEGYCRNYQEITVADCPKRFAQPGSGREEPRGRDYYGGDLEGVTEKLQYLKDLGVTVIYFNPIFAAGSNHRYDTRDFKIIDPYLGDLGDWKTLQREAQELGIRIILDGVFNHMSSDSPIFDRYHNWKSDKLTLAMKHQIYMPLVPQAAQGNGPGPVQGACESVSSPYRSWFRFRQPAATEPAVCAPYTRTSDSYYSSWAGFDSLPQLSEEPVVQNYIFGAEDSVARYWLQEGGDGWRLDVMQDKSIPFWEGFRAQVKDVDPDAIIIGELWKKFDVLPYVQGNTADSAMNYRLRDAVLGLLVPGAFDAKGFPGSGNPIPPSDFADRLLSVREDYPDAAYYSLMNLLDSHDTERLLWTLTPGAENRQQREANAANLAEGKQRQRIAAMIQATMPGAPTIYYGDEVGLTGDDDPDDRRTYPWGDARVRADGDTRDPDLDLLAYYSRLTEMRRGNQAMIDGDLRFLLTDDTNGTVAYGRKHENHAAIVAINASKQQRTLTIPVAGYLPNSTVLVDVVGCGVSDYPREFTVANGTLTLTLPALCSLSLMTRDADLTPTAAPTNLQATASGLSVALSWTGVAGASGYNVYRSPVTRGGFELVNTVPITSPGFIDNSTDLRSGQRYYYVVKALDNLGNESAPSNEASAVPSYPIGWANLQWPPTLTYTVSAVNPTDTVYGQVYIENVTIQPGATPGLIAQLGYGAAGSDPRLWNTWVGMEFNANVGNNDEFKGNLQPTVPGTYDYFTRYSTNGGTSWTYGDLDGIESGSFADQTDSPGKLTVNPNPDQTPPDAPANLQASNGGATTVRLSWTASTATDVYRYDIYRSTTAGSGYVRVASVDENTTEFADTDLLTGTRYYYVVRAVDEANNTSPPSNEASAVPLARDVQVTFEVTVPAGTPADRTVYIVGNQPQICNWCNPHTVALTKGADGKWRVTLTFTEGTEVEYKYTLGSWDFVEKDASCGEVGNRQIRVVGDGSNTQLVTDTVANFRSVPPCGA